MPLHLRALQRLNAAQRVQALLRRDGPWLLWQVVDAAPLTVFLVYVSAAHPASTAAWRGPYYSAAMLAALATILRLATHGLLNRIHVAIGLYFVSGSMALAFEWSWLNQFYGRTEATAMLYWVLLIGAVSTLASRAGFIGVEAAPALAVRRTSLALLGIALIATVFSGYFRGNVALSAYVPFVALFLGHALLRGRCLGQSQPLSARQPMPGALR